MRHLFLWLFLLIFLPLSVNAAVPVPPKIPMVAVMPFTGRALDSDVLETIAATLATDLLNTGKFRVMERSQMESILKEQGFQQSGSCDGSECAVEVGKLLSVDHMVVGTVGKVGGTYVVNARLVSVQTGEVLKSTSQTSQAEVDAIVTDLLPQVAQGLSEHGGPPVAAAPAVSTPSTGYAGHFTDTRDGQSYKYVKIGSQTWMAENLNYKTGSSWCYYNNASNCQKYGRLYDWQTARSACPGGWHLPSDQEWSTLVQKVDSATSGFKLKANSNLWSTNTGTNLYDFSVLPAGRRSFDETFDGLGYYAYFWSSSENAAFSAWYRYAVSAQ